MTPVYDRDGITVYHADCLDLLPALSGIDAVVADPPYGMAWDTDCERFSGGNKHHRKSVAGRDWGESIHGDGQPFDPSPWIVFPRVVLWGMNHFAARLPVGTTLVWVKRHEDAFGSFLSDAKVAWMKGGHGVYLHKDLSMNSEARRRVHPTQKPIGLMRWSLDRAGVPPDAMVLDPFAGSGTTGVACMKTGRRCILIEKDERNINTIIKRLQAAETPLFQGLQ